MMDYKIIIAYVSIAVAFVSYVPYFRGIITNKTKPHAFSWLIWSITPAIAFFAQVVTSGGAGAWVTGFTSLLGLIIFLIALSKGETKFVLFDYISFLLALTAIALWILTNNPLMAVILAIAIDWLGFLPTVRKGYYRPFEETISLYSLSALKWMLGLIALQTFSLTTALFPGCIMFGNIAFAVMLWWRRKKSTLL